MGDSFELYLREQCTLRTEYFQNSLMCFNINCSVNFNTSANFESNVTVKCAKLYYNCTTITIINCYSTNNISVYDITMQHNLLLAKWAKPFISIWCMTKPNALEMVLLNHAQLGVPPYHLSTLRATTYTPGISH